METNSAVSWRSMGRHTGVLAVLAGGVLVGAVSIYLAASVLPSAVDDIGGQRFYAWSMTVFLVGQVSATMLTAWVLQRLGAVRAQVAGLGVFALGSVLCALAPVMPVLLLGRGVQGLGAGLLTGLGFALIGAVLPAELWSRGSAVISGMYGLGNFVGPALGGALAQVGAWRWSFALLAVVTVALAFGVPRVLGQVPRSEAIRQRVPIRSLLLVVIGVMAVGGASLTDSRPAMVGLVMIGLVGMVLFVVCEKRVPRRILPAQTFRSASPLRWTYITVAILAGAVAIETFLPLLGQRLGELPPVIAGFFGAALSLGWAVTQIWSASARGRSVVVLMIFGPALLSVCLLALALLITPEASTTVVLTWLVALILAGAGIGAAMPHLTVIIISSGTDAGQAQQAAASVATVLTMATASGSAQAGLLFNLGQPDLVTSARYLIIGFAALAALGVISTAKLVRNQPAHGS